jgi:uncharacterized protein (DUF2249 family)
VSTITLATSEADAAAVEAVERHHAHLAGALDVLVDDLLHAARVPATPAAGATRDRVVAWCRRELLPHASAEEVTLYPASQALPEARLLVASMLAEHRLITGLVERIERAPDLIRAAAAAEALRTSFAAHLDEENDLLLPLLAAAPTVALGDLLEGMHDLLGGGTAVRDEACGHACACGEEGAEDPVLDARTVPHAIRHATVFGALDAVATGQALVLLAPHDPLPLLSHMEARTPGAFAVEYLERGPDTWRLRLARRTV